MRIFTLIVCHFSFSFSFVSVFVGLCSFPYLSHYLFWWGGSFFFSSVLYLRFVVAPFTFQIVCLRMKRAFENNNELIEMFKRSCFVVCYVIKCGHLFHFSPFPHWPCKRAWKCSSFGLSWHQIWLLYAYFYGVVSWRWQRTWNTFRSANHSVVHV